MTMKKTEEIKMNYFNETETMLLKNVWAIIERNKDEMIEDFYTHLEQTGKFRVILNNYDTNKLKSTFSIWLTNLSYVNYDEQYTEKRETLSDDHQAIQVPMRFMLSALGYIRSSLNYYIYKEIGEHDPGMAIRVRQSVNKALDLELLMISKSYARNKSQS